jgi:hypothetical protein
MASWLPSCIAAIAFSVWSIGISSLDGFVANGRNPDDDCARAHRAPPDDDGQSTWRRASPRAPDVESTAMQLS